ncbi:hypothetical protein BDZ91DRAFT_723730 [Kalaharituber pfeilii]|nr:hypothetical protein BDZ91DRAFT_723730 [Kalaharituber pfeilii]
MRHSYLGRAPNCHAALYHHAAAVLYACGAAPRTLGTVQKCTMFTQLLSTGMQLRSEPSFDAFLSFLQISVRGALSA